MELLSESREQIIKGLECCIGDFDACRECPYKGGHISTCTLQVKIDALELIRLQEMQINRQSEMILPEMILLDHPAPEPHDAANHPEPHDAVNHPGHYTQGGIECIDALKAATTGLEGIEAVCTANAIKYLWRWKQKNGAEDLRKAEWYINRLIAETEEKA